MWTDNDLKNELSVYKIEGDITELSNILYSNAQVLISESELLSVLSKDKTNYIRIAYGDSLIQAYKDGINKGCKCRLVHIFFTDGSMNFQDLSSFIDCLGRKIIFGYSKNETIKYGVKLVMILN